MDDVGEQRHRLLCPEIRNGAYFYPLGKFVDCDQQVGEVLGNSGKPVTLETLSLTKFSKHVFQEQGIRNSRKPGTYEVSNSRMCRVRES
jgi:hypothetical protein